MVIEFQIWNGRSAFGALARGFYLLELINGDFYGNGFETVVLSTNDKIKFCHDRLLLLRTAIFYIVS